MAELFFGDLRLDTKALELDGPLGRVELRPKALELLRYLIEHRHRFVPSSELMAVLWPDVRVTRASVTQCVSELRQCLGDSADSPRFIETKVKFGYRFIATLYHRPTERLEPLPPPSGLVTDSRRRPSGRQLIAAGVAVAVGLGGLAIWQHSRDDRRRVVVAVVAGTPDRGDPEALELAERLRVLAVGELAGMLDGAVVGASSAGASHRLEVAVRELHGARVEVELRLLESGQGVVLWGWTFSVPSDAGDELDSPFRRAVSDAARTCLAAGG